MTQSNQTPASTPGSQPGQQQPSGGGGLKGLWHRANILGKIGIAIVGFIVAILLLKLFFKVIGGILGFLIGVVVVIGGIWLLRGNLPGATAHGRGHGFHPSPSLRGIDELALVPVDYVHDHDFMERAKIVLVDHDGTAYWSPDSTAGTYVNDNGIRIMTVDEFIG